MGAGAGSEALPPFTNFNDLDNGMYFPGTNQVGFSTAGSKRLILDAAGSTMYSNFTVSGTGSPAALSNTKINSFDTIAGFMQNNIQNLSAHAAASSDWIATADTGTDSTNYIDMGINSSAYSVGTWTINGALD